jgi:hypothetical protein
MHRLPGTVGALTLAAVLTTAAAASPPAHAATSGSRASAAARATDYYRRDGSAVHITDARTYTLSLRSASAAGWATTTGTDVTAWFVGAGGGGAFTDTRGVARATRSADRRTLTIRIDASRITGFTASGSTALYVRPAAGALAASAGHTPYTPLATAVGDYTVPELDVTSNIAGSAYTHGKSTLKEHFGGVVTYAAGTRANLALKLPGLDDSGIGTTGAKVQLTSGDGYYPSEYVLKTTTLDHTWAKGRTSYSLQQGDLAINTGDYPVTDPDSGREWSCLGGDGQGNYTFNLTVSGITYHGLPVAPRTFRVHISIYGYNYTSDAAALYGSGTTVEPDFAPLDEKVADPPERASRPVWTWVGEGGEPNLTDAKADDFYVTWPRGVNASALRASDVTVTLRSTEGDTHTLKAGRDFQLDTSSGESQIAVTLQNWAFEPVYSTLDVKVSPAHLKGDKSKAPASSSYDITSVYVYEAQQGGGGTTVDGTVTAYSFYGLDNLTSPDQVMSPVTYTLSTSVDGQTEYYAEDAQGHGTLVGTAAAAKVYDGSGAEDRNVRLIGNTVYTTTRLNRTATHTVDGTSLTFAKTYAGGKLLAPAAADPALRTAPGYAVDTSFANWVSHEKWAWQSSIAVGWTGIDIQPYTGKFEWSVARGATQQFTADDPSVTWKILGDVSRGTSISPTGLLTVAPGESSTGFAVVATSKTDTSREGQGTVNVTVTGAAGS